MSAQPKLKESRRSVGLAVTLATAFIVMSIVSVALASAFQIVLNLQTQQEAIAGQLQVIALGAAQEVAGFTEQVSGALESAAQAGQPLDGTTQEQQLLLGNLLGLQPAFREVAVMDAAGQELSKISRLAVLAEDDLRDLGRSELYTQVSQGQRYISPVRIDETTSEPLVTVAVPIENAFGEFEGALLADVNLKFMWDLVDSLRIGQEGLAYVVDREGNLLALGDTSRVLRGENLSQLDEVARFIASTDLTTERAGALSNGINGTSVLATHVTLGTPDWAVVIELPAAEAYQEVVANVALALGGSLIIALVAGVAGVFVARRLAAPLLNLTDTATRIAGGETALTADIEGPTEVASLAGAFNSMTGQLRELIGSLEQQVADRTQDLAQRSAYLEATAEVGRAAASILEVDQLMRQVVELVRERFGLYYVGLFQVEQARDGAGQGSRPESGSWAMLRAGTGEAGQTMLERGHRIKVGEGMVGWSIAHNQPRVALEAGADAVRLATAELPETRSEAALPLRSRGQVIGALSVQHTEIEAFDQDTLAVLQVMADQVAVALDNARLFAESQQALEAERRAYGEISREAWEQMVRRQAVQGYRSNPQGVAPSAGRLQPQVRRAVKAGQVVVGEDGDAPAVSVPIPIRDQVVGALNFRKADTGETWTDEELTLLQNMAEQLGQALESARLYQDTQRREAQERLVGEVSSRMRETLDMDTVLRTAALELEQRLDLYDVTIRLTAEDEGG
jgi:GAF domain-containing protein/HAMP domain-containing protein